MKVIPRLDVSCLYKQTGQASAIFPAKRAARRMGRVWHRRRRLKTNHLHLDSEPPYAARVKSLDRRPGHGHGHGHGPRFASSTEICVIDLVLCHRPSFVPWTEFCAIERDLRHRARFASSTEFCVIDRVLCHRPSFVSSTEFCAWPSFVSVLTDERQYLWRVKSNSQIRCSHERYFIVGWRAISVLNKKYLLFFRCTVPIDIYMLGKQSVSGRSRLKNSVLSGMLTRVTSVQPRYQTNNWSGGTF